MSKDTTKGCTIQSAADGPLVLTGNVQVNGTDHDQGTALCRCGQSQNKPYCDGSHKSAGFTDEGNLDPAGVASRQTDAEPPLQIKAAKNGPLMCSGPFTLVSADGATEVSGTRTTLCRCGHSANKPYCDGAHSKHGFEAG